jgi:TolB protein
MRQRRLGLIGGILLSLIVIGCLPEGVRVPQSPLLRSLERKAGLITYVGVDGNIYTMDQGGGRQQAITNDAKIPDTPTGEFRLYQFPIWSPDSRRIAFIGVRGAQNTPGTASVFTAVPDGSDRQEIFTSHEWVPFYLYWSPDGKRLSFLASVVTTGNTILQTVPVEGGEAQVVDAGQPYYWAWSPDSRRMIIHAGGDALAPSAERLAFLTLDGEIVEEGLSLRPARFQAPAWSPDGRWVLLAARAAEGQGTLLVTDHQGTVEKELATFQGAVAFGWSPDGKKIAYIAGEDQQPGVIGPLTVMDVENPTAVKTAQEDKIAAFFWSPDSRKVAYFVPSVVSPTPEPDQAEKSAPSGQPQQVTVLLTLHVLDVQRGRDRRIATFQPTSQFLGILPYFDQYQRSATIWSPDSRNLVLPAYASDGKPGIWVVPASGALEMRYLADGLLAFWSWR